MVRKLNISLIACAVLVVAITPAAAAIRVTLSYTSVEVEISPRQEVHRTNYVLHYTLDGRSIHFQSSNGQDHTGDLGQTHSVTGVTGERYDTRMRVDGGNRLVSTSSYPSHIVKTTITTNGVDACSAVREAILKPGHRYFSETRISNHEPMTVSELRFENMSCTIEAQ